MGCSRNFFQGVCGSLCSPPLVPLSWEAEPEPDTLSPGGDISIHLMLHVHVPSRDSSWRCMVLSLIETPRATGPQSFTQNGRNDRAGMTCFQHMNRMGSEMPTKVGLLCQPLVSIYQGFIHSDHPGVSLPVRQHAPRLVHSRGLYTSPSCSENSSYDQARSLRQNKGKSKLPHASGGWSIQVPYSSPVLAGAPTESQVAGCCREQDPDSIVSFLWYQVRSSDATLTDSVMSCQGQPSSLGQAGCY